MGWDGATKPCNTTGTATDDGSLTEAQFNWDVARDLVPRLEGLGATVGIVGANIEDAAPVVPAIGDTEVTCTGGIPGVICPVDGAQVTAVPAIVGSEASGNGANVVSGAGWVSAENGLGPLSGED